MVIIVGSVVLIGYAIYQKYRAMRWPSAALCAFWFAAIADNHPNIVQHMLTQHPSLLRQCNSVGENGLMLAVLHGHGAVAQVLLQHNAQHSSRIATTDILQVAIGRGDIALAHRLLHAA